MVQIFKAKKSAKQPSQNKPLEMQVDKLDMNGVGVARYQGKPAFIAHALPGEKVKVKVTSQNNKLIKAKLLSVIDESEHREQVKCSHFYHCGGCDLQHASHTAQLEFKQDKVTQLFSRQGITDLPWHAAISGEGWHYRRKARIGVQYDKQGKAIIGFRQKSSNDIASIKQCPILPKSAELLFTHLNDVLSQLKAKKAIGHIELIFTEQLHLVIRQLKKLTDYDKNVWLSAAEQNNWQLFIDAGEEIYPITSDCKLEYAIDNVKLQFKPEHFIQVNAQINARMVALAIEWLSPQQNDRVLDLFCGLGNFSLAIAGSVNEVVGVEGVQDMVQQAQLNAQQNNIENCHFYQANLNADWHEQAFSKGSFSKIILDPARAGALEACQQLVDFKPEKLLYVSCEPSTLAVDAAFLIKQGYLMTKIVLIDMFSQTKHVETMVLFERSPQ